MEIDRRSFFKTTLISAVSLVIPSAGKSDSDYTLSPKWCDALGLPRGTKFHMLSLAMETDHRSFTATEYICSLYPHIRAKEAFGGYWSVLRPWSFTYPAISVWYAPAISVLSWPGTEVVKMDEELGNLKKVAQGIYLNAQIMNPLPENIDIVVGDYFHYNLAE